jgi:hypothetical protein
LTNPLDEAGVTARVTVVAARPPVRGRGFATTRWRPLAAATA